jgi:hypothetical protein
LVLAIHVDLQTAHSVSPEGNRGWKSSIAPVFVMCKGVREEGEGKRREMVEVKEERG